MSKIFVLKDAKRNIQIIQHQIKQHQAEIADIEKEIAEYERLYADAKLSFQSYIEHFNQPVWGYSKEIFGTVENFVRLAVTAINNGFLIKSLNISDPDFGLETILELKPVFHCYGLKEINIAGCKLYSSNCRELGKILKKNTQFIKSIDLSDTKIDCGDLDIFQIFNSSSKLRSINLSNNYFGFRVIAVEKWIKHIQYYSIQELYLSNCKLQGENTDMVIKMAQEWYGLKHLHLDGNQLTENSIPELVKFINESTKIESLKIDICESDNNNKLIAAIQNSTSLQYFNDKLVSRVTTEATGI